MGLSVGWIWHKKYESSSRVNAAEMRSLRVCGVGTAVGQSEEYGDP